jgi:hypothetical protein
LAAFFLWFFLGLRLAFFGGPSFSLFFGFFGGSVPVLSCATGC